MTTITISDYKKLIKPSKHNKYNAEICEYNCRKYDSKKEMEYAVNLDWKKKGGLIKDWIPQFKIEIIVAGQFICNYLVDFKVIYSDGHEKYHEVKSEGTMTDLWKLKWKLVKALYPHYKWVLIK
jgi:hypothetical protein